MEYTLLLLFLLQLLSCEILVTYMFVLWPFTVILKEIVYLEMLYTLKVNNISRVPVNALSTSTNEISAKLKWDQIKMYL